MSFMSAKSFHYHLHLFQKPGRVTVGTGCCLCFAGSTVAYMKAKGLLSGFRTVLEGLLSVKSFSCLFPHVAKHYGNYLGMGSEVLVLSYYVKGVL